MSESARPRVSVILQTYEHGPFIAQAIEGVLLQRLDAPVEVIIADDASTDGTRESVVRYARANPERIRTLLPEENLGPSELFTRGLAEARGEYVAYLDGDDYWTSPHKLSRQVAALDTHPEWAGCFHRAALVYGRGGSPHAAAHTIPDVDPGESLGLDELIAGASFVPGPSWMHRRSSLEELPSLEGIEWSDWMTHIMVARSGPIGFLDEVLTAYRVHSGGAYGGRDRSAQLEEDLRFYGRLAQELPSSRSLIDRCLENRRCQIAVETARLPFGAPVLVVGPADEIPLYFNGRWSRRLPRRREDIDGDLLADLDRACADLAKLPPSLPNSRPRLDPLRSDPGTQAFVLVPRGARAWLERHADLASLLEERAVPVVESEDCDILRIELAAPGGRPAASAVEPLSVLSAALVEPLPDGLRGNLEAPRAGESVSGHAIYVVGWALGDGDPVEAVEFELDGKLIARAALGVERPDLGEAFGDDPDAWRAGFQAVVNVEGGSGEEIEVDLFAASAGGRSRFGKLSLRRAR